LIAFTDDEPGWEATEEQPGICYVPIELKDKRAVKTFGTGERDKSYSRLSGRIAHWDQIGIPSPAEHPPFAHALIDAGADVLFGHSGHIVRGIELYRGKPIPYCTGDFY